MSSSPAPVDLVVHSVLAVGEHGLQEPVTKPESGKASRTVPGAEDPVTTVHSLASGLKIDYPLPPREAVAAAYAQYAKNDPITLSHREELLQKYGHLVKETERVVAIGDFVALKDDNPRT